LRHGASVDKKNRDGNTCRDLCREGDQDIIDLLTGDAALLDASKKGHLNRVMKILTPENVNCRDSQGRNSTPLHLASGYNNLEVAEYLLENGADCNASDKGGLIPLHNAASYGYVFSSYTTLYLIFSLKHFYSKKSFRYSSASH
jgi:tankyrase